MKRILLVCLALALLTACSGTAIPHTDWCYQFDFRNSNYGVNVDAGSWAAGSGFRSDDQGRFSLDYTNGADVTPAAAVIHVARSDSNQLPIDVSGAANIFGINSGFVQSTVPQDVNSVDLTILSGSGGLGHGTVFVIGGHTSRQIQLEWLQVLGDGSNPFPTSNCTVVQPDSLVTPIPIPLTQIGGAIGQGDQLLATVNAPLTSPDGSPLLPDEDGGLIFAYTKWVIAPQTAQELAGPFAPIIISLGILMVADMALFAVYVAIYAGVYFIRWAVWIFRLVLQIIEAIASAAGGVIGALLSFIGL